MMASRVSSIFAISFCLAGFAAPGLAVEVYQWTDENGVVHYSQWAPGDHVDSVETVRVDGGGESRNGLGISEEDDPYGFQAHREEMDALWAEIEERREAAQSRQEAAPTTEIIYLDSEPGYSVPYYPGFRPRPPHWEPGDRPRPPRPDVEEPSRPGTSTLKRP